MNALEVAIEGSAKNFVASPLVQRLLSKVYCLKEGHPIQLYLTSESYQTSIIDDIWRGNIVFFASAIGKLSFHSHCDARPLCESMRKL